MNDILFGNNNKAVIQKLAKRSLKAKKNTIAILAIMLATLLFTSLFTIAISLQTAMQESNMRTTGTSAHAGIKRLSWEEYEQLSSDAGIKDSGYSIIIGNAVGENFNKVPTELRYGDETYANVSRDFIREAESLNGLEDIGSVYLWTSKQPLSKHDLARLQELSASSGDIANELENYTVRQEHGVNVYGLDDFPAEYVQILDGELNMEKWKAGTGVYVTPLRMMDDGSYCLYQPGDKISVSQLDGTSKVYEVLAVVNIPKALQTPLQVDMGLDYIFPSSELLGNMVSVDQPAMKTIFNVDDENQLAAENWLKNYTTNTDTALDYLSKVTLRQTFDGMINMYRLVGGTLCVILALIGILNFINSMMTSILSRHKELAMLQSVGMTGNQVKRMLMYEGIGYSVLGLLSSLILSIVGSLTVVRMMGAELSYFTWHFTLLPVFLCIIPLFLITALVPLICYNKMAQKTVVERLRIAE